MSTEIATTQTASAGAIEKVLIGGDLKELKTEERLSYYNRVCESLGLNPLTQPFAYLSLSGKLTLYARKDAAEQLRRVQGISLRILSREIVDGMYVVTCEASTPTGRTDSATGVIDCAKLTGEAKANAMMKAETKAKRRVTLSICGLGLMDETEVDSVPGARKVSVKDAHEGRLLPAADAVAEPTTQPKREERPIPEELKDAVAKLRIGDIGVISTTLSFLRGELTQAYGDTAIIDDAQMELRKRFPKPAVIPTEELIGMWLDVFKHIESARFAAEANNV